MINRKPDIHTYSLKNIDNGLIINVDKKGKLKFNEVKKLILKNKYLVYKNTRIFRRLNDDEYDKFSGLLLTHINIDKECKLLSDIKEIRFFLTKLPHKEIMKIKMIDEIV